MVLLLAGPLRLARPFLGAAGSSRAARFLRVGTCAALLALVPAEATVYQFSETPPRGGTDLRLYLLIAWKVGGKEPLKILFLVLMALYVAAIFWMTSRRSRIAPATLAAGTGVASLSAWSCTRWRRSGSARRPPTRGCPDPISTRSCCSPGCCCSAAR